MTTFTLIDHEGRPAILTSTDEDGTQHLRVFATQPGQDDEFVRIYKEEEPEPAPAPAAAPAPAPAAASPDWETQAAAAGWGPEAATPPPAPAPAPVASDQTAPLEVDQPVIVDPSTPPAQQ